jgi:putative glutamine amidotransferase
MKPLIGITCSLKRDDPACLDGRSFDYAKREYYRRLETHGGIPVLLPNVEQEDTILDVLSRVDGLLLAGGEDIDPSWYDEENRFPQSVIHPDRDRAEILLARKACERGLPVLAICRGIQTMNVAFGGSLHQDVSLRPRTGNHKVDEPYAYLVHDVTIVKDSLLFRLAGKEIVQVNSRHHQILNRIAPEFIVSATAPDGVVEAIESIDAGRYLLGVQWHPEMAPDDALSIAIFRDFVSMASRTR